MRTSFLLVQLSVFNEGRRAGQLALHSSMYAQDDLTDEIAELMAKYETYELVELILFNMYLTEYKYDHLYREHIALFLC